MSSPICVLNFILFQLFSTLKQPLKGFAKLLLCFVFAAAMYKLYEWALPPIVGEELPVGYAKEIWIATAMLGITFSAINMVAGSFNF